jgi:hypothetical protein
LARLRSPRLLTASVRRRDGGAIGAGRWHIAYSQEIAGANGQGRTKAAALKSLANAIALILDDRKDGLRVKRHEFVGKVAPDADGRPNHTLGRGSRCALRP